MNKHARAHARTQECIGWKAGGRHQEPELGRCMATTVRYVPSMPTGLDFAPDESGGLGWVLHAQASFLQYVCPHPPTTLPCSHSILKVLACAGWPPQTRPRTGMRH